MKKILLSMVILFGGVMFASAQYKPTQSDVGRDCTTQDGKLGTWKNVRVEDGASSSSSRGDEHSGNASIKIGTSDFNVGGGYGYSTSSSSSSSSSERISYDDIRCVEDKNATLPQQTPIRW